MSAATEIAATDPAPVISATRFSNSSFTAGEA